MTTSFIVHAKWIAPVVPRQTLLEDHCLAVTDGTIAMLGTADEVQAAHPNLPEVRLDNHLLMPGIVNCHGHAAMTLLRGYVDDINMMRWLTDAIWPVEGKLVDADFVYDGTRLAAAEMLRTGTTCTADSYFFPEASGKAFEEMKMRAQVGLCVIKFSNAWARDEEDHIHKGLAWRDTAKNSPRITTAFAPHAPYSVTNEGFERVMMYAEELEMPIHLHLHETAQEVTDSVAEFGVSPVMRLKEIGVMSPGLQAVHATQLREDEIDVLAANGCHVIHCPESNLKLASGYCPVQALLNKGVNVALGTDGAASNNNLDMIEELRTATLLTKMNSGDAENFPAWAALEMLTIDGARCLGLESSIGSLEAGKQADMAAIDFSGLRFQPMYNPVSQLIYNATGQDTSHVWVGGDLLLEEGELVQADMPSILDATFKWQERIKAMQ